MAQNLFQGEDATTVHNEMTCKRVAQDVACLTPRQLDTASLERNAKRTHTTSEAAMSGKMLSKALCQVGANRHRADSLRLCINERDGIIPDKLRPQTFGL